ncbi:MAG: DUF4037 domain-containing protein [Lachnospiraceae bacterium]|nr:DUF4037 domain-containing protein [Candidatus Colinaster scatohippi]
MDINQIYSELDSLEYTKIEGYLQSKIDEAESRELFEIQVPLLNEMIGFLRDTTQFDKGQEYKRKLLGVLDDYNQQGTMNYATSLLNIANFDRAAGDYPKSIEEYKRCEEIYNSLLPKEDYLWAGLYNNESLLYQMMGDNLAAIGSLAKALQIVQALPDRRMEVATTYTNIAQSLAALGQMDEAEENVQAALEIFAETNNEDYHYSAAAAVMGVIAYNRGEFAVAADYYEKAAAVVKKVMGENENYRLLISNRDAMLAMLPSSHTLDGTNAKENGAIDNATDEVLSGENVENPSGLELCRLYYLQCGRPGLEKNFEKYLGRIAVGLFGEGSECIGCDDEYSRDHDWGPGFMLLVTRQTYSEIGRQLEQFYAGLPDTFMGYKRKSTDEAGGRVGVVIIEDYFRKWIGKALLTNNGRLSVERKCLGNLYEFALCNMTNGEVWADTEGIVSDLRKEISMYYDNDTWIKHLSVELIRMGQTGQYNLDRCLKRDDKVTAYIYLGEYIRSTLQVLFLLNKKYAPYEKWMLRNALRLELHPEIADCIKAIADMNIDDKNLLMTVEIIAQIVLSALKELKLVDENEDNWYLEKIGRNLR